MKKKLAILLVLIMVLSMFTLSACGKEKEEEVKYFVGPYDNYDLSKYVTLPNYDSYSYEKPVGEASEADINTKVNGLLGKYPNVTVITEGTVGLGDTVTISFDGVLEDGTTMDGMSSDSFEMTLGETSMIEGFTESIIGKKIGEVFSAKMSFPDPYPNNTTLSGKGVTFTIKVLQKTLTEPATLTEEWVTKNTNYKSIDELMAAVEKEVVETSAEAKLNTLKSEILNTIMENSEVSEIIQEKIEEETKLYNGVLHAMATSYGVDWETFLSDYISKTEEEFNAEAKDSIGELVKGDMIAYAIAQKEGVKILQSTMDNYKASLLSYYGVDEATFEEGMGITVMDYVHYYGYDYNLYLDAAMGKICERIIK